MKMTCKKIYIKCETAGNRPVVSHIILSLAILGAILGLSSCKTTVQNYQSAYDVAVQKKLREDSARRELQKEMGLPTELSEDAEGFSKMTRNGEEFYTFRKNFQKKDSIDVYSVCVSAFKMPANAASMTDELTASGFPETRYAESSDKYYVITATTPEIDSAIEALKNFRKKNPNWRCVGIPGYTIIIGRGK